MPLKWLSLLLVILPLLLRNLICQLLLLYEYVNGDGSPKEMAVQLRLKIRNSIEANK